MSPMEQTNIPLIRPAIASDAAAILHLIKSHAEHEKEPYDPEGKLEHLQWWLSLENRNCTFLVVEENKTLIGYCTFALQFDTWYQKEYLFLDALYLEPAARGKGLGRALMERAVEEAKAKAVTTVQLVTPAHNHGAIAFYKKLGGRSTTKEWFTFELPQ